MGPNVIRSICSSIIHLILLSIILVLTELVLNENWFLLSTPTAPRAPQCRLPTAPGVHLDGLNAETHFTPHYTLYNCVCDK